MDDDSANPNSALLTGVTQIKPGESVIFIEVTSSQNATTVKNGGDADAARGGFPKAIEDSTKAWNGAKDTDNQ